MPPPTPPAYPTASMSHSRLAEGPVTGLSFPQGGFYRLAESNTLSRCTEAVCTRGEPFERPREWSHFSCATTCFFEVPWVGKEAEAV